MRNDVRASKYEKNARRGEEDKNCNLKFNTKEIFYKQFLCKFSLISSFFFFKLRRNSVKMDGIEEAASANIIGITISRFLSETGRVLQAIEVFKECLIILRSHAQAINSSLANFVFRVIYKEMICAYLRIKDFTSAEKCLKELFLYLDSKTPLKKDGYIYTWQAYFSYKINSRRPGNFTNQQSTS